VTIVLTAVGLPFEDVALILAMDPAAVSEEVGLVVDNCAHRSALSHIIKEVRGEEV
jgi:Na+/H+-dicarboxylate symporter